MKKKMIFRKSQNRYTNGTIFGTLEMIHPDFPQFPLATVNVFAEPLNVPSGRYVQTIRLGDKEDCLTLDFYENVTVMKNHLSNFAECPIFLIMAYSDDTVEYTLRDGSKHTMVWKNGAELKTPEDKWVDAIISFVDETLETLVQKQILVRKKIPYSI